MKFHYSLMGNVLFLVNKYEEATVAFHFFKQTKKDRKYLIIFL